MTEHTHSGFRHELVWYPRSTLSGHIRAIAWMALAAGVVVFGFGR